MTIPNSSRVIWLSVHSSGTLYTHHSCTHKYAISPTYICIKIKYIIPHLPASQGCASAYMCIRDSCWAGEAEVAANEILDHL